MPHTLGIRYERLRALCLELTMLGLLNNGVHTIIAEVTTQAGKDMGQNLGGNPERSCFLSYGGG